MTIKRNTKSQTHALALQFSSVNAVAAIYQSGLHVNEATKKGDWFF